MSKEWSNLSKVVTKRTYARTDKGSTEGWLYPTDNSVVERVIGGNVRGFDVSLDEINRLKYFAGERKAFAGGRGLWMSGAPAHERIGGAALNNCWALTAEQWKNFIYAMDLLMLGGGVGMSVEHRFVSKLPRVKKGVVIEHRDTKDADFIVPDSREGWCELITRVFESFFDTGRSFTYSTVCIRGYGEKIKGFGGSASGPIPLIEFVKVVSRILGAREGKHIRPIDAADITCAIGAMVKAGNVRRSAIIILGDPWDKEYLVMKRWDLQTLPAWRSNANFSVVCEDIEDLHPLFWKTYEHGEPYGLINRKNIQTYGRMGERKKDTAYLVNPCVPAATEILTNVGYIPIDELIGQQVLVWNGFEFSEVEPRATGHNQPLVTVTLSSGQSLTCTEYHEFVIALDYKGATKRVRATDLEPGMKLIKTSYPVITQGETIHPDRAYTQGFVSAEGMDDYKGFSLYAPKYCCLDRLSVRKKDYDLNGCRVHVTVSCEKLPKSFVPFDWNLEAKLNWLAGLADGDGTVLNEGGIQISSINRKFLLDVQKMLTTMGVFSKINVMSRSGFRSMPDGHGGTKDYYCQDCYRVCIGSQEVQFLIGLGMRCNRLKIGGFYPNRNASRFNTVVDVEEAGEADIVYCFTEPRRNLACFEGVVTGQCAEACLEPFEPCNLQEIALCNLSGVEEFVEAARLMHRYGKRVTCAKYHIPETQKVIDRNRRVGTSLTGFLNSPLSDPDVLDTAYRAIQDENAAYSKELGIPLSIRTTLNKPSGTVSKVMDCEDFEGIKARDSRYMIQRIRFEANDPLIPLLRTAGHRMEPEIKLDGSLDHGTQVVDFYLAYDGDGPIKDEGFDTWKQLDTLVMAQKWWADQAVSTTVYYRRSEIPQIKEWLTNNLKFLKTISFLVEDDHGFKQAPKESITQEQYETLSKNISPIPFDEIENVGDIEIEGCESGLCPVK